MKPRAPRAYVAVYYTDGMGTWPRDLGDDPAFGAHLDGKGELTWGVCRPDLRNALRPDDLVIFFATTQKPSREQPSPYWFVGFATVGNKIAQDAIWRSVAASKYRRYLNLLIRPKTANKTTFEHHEPCAGQDHPDWLWRLVRHAGKKKEYVTLSGRNIVTPGKDKRPGGGRLVLADNYVIFSDDRRLTSVLGAPPVVAHATKPGVGESWLEQFQALRKIIFPSSSGRRSLRTTNPRNGAHRHVRIDGDVVRIRESLSDLVGRPAYGGGRKTRTKEEVEGEAKAPPRRTR